MKVVHVPKQSRFDLMDDSGSILGEIAYMPGGESTLYATHTLVEPEYNGRGYASILLDALCTYARENDKKIVPMCGYVVGRFRKEPDKYADINARSEA